MAGKEKDWHLNSLPLKFLLGPFRAALILAMIILIVFGVSLVTQTYFQKHDLLKGELEVTQQLGVETMSDNNMPINLTMAKHSYSILNTVFFDFTRINKALKAIDPTDFGFSLKQKILIPNLESLQLFDDILKVVSLRLGNMFLFVGFFFLINGLAIVDGLAMRAIRQKNASRESAGIYHRAKYFRAGFFWMGIMIYLALPFTVSPALLMVPISLTALMVWFQAKYYKKYL